jgi:acetolactate synthase I/II/III large subunit
MTTEATTAADALVDILRREGVTVLFAIPGAPLLPFFDRLVDHPEIRVILHKHEEGAAYAAYAYARATGRLGVCVATLGPGATNLLSGLPISLIGSVPILAITGQIQTTAYAKGAHQDSTGWFRTPDQEAMSKATTKHTATCADASRFPDIVRHAIRIAMSGRPGPAHLIIPANLLEQTVAYTPLAPAQYRSVEEAAYDDRRAAEVSGLLADAKFPLILVGERATLPDAGAKIQSLAEQFSIPVATDLACKSIVDEWSSMYLGCMGVTGHKSFDRYLHERCDVLLTVGQTFNEVSTLSWDPALAEGRKLVQLDLDEQEIGKVYPVAMAAVGHLPTLIERIGEHLSGRPSPARAAREEIVAELRTRYPLFDAPEMTSEKVPLLPQRVVAELRATLPDDAIVLSDSSKWTRWFGRYYQARRRTVLTAHDYEPMGWAVAGAIGARMAHPDRPIACVSGDGAFLMAGMEVSTAANHDLKIIWVIMNDARLGVIYDMQNLLYGGRISATRFKNPDYVKFAEAFGLHGRAITRPGELTRALGEALSADRSTVLDVRFDPDEIPPIRPRAVLITTQMGLPNPKPGPEATRAMVKILKEK